MSSLEVTPLSNEDVKLLPPQFLRGGRRVDRWVTLAWTKPVRAEWAEKLSRWADLPPAREEILRGQLKSETHVEDWTFFWKRRDSGNRVMVAHPEPHSFSVTLALDADSARALAHALETERVPFLLSEKIATDRFSNLEIRFV